MSFVESRVRLKGQEWLRSLLPVSVLDPVRQAALEHLQHSGIPTRDNEEWRFTDVSPLAQQPFLPGFVPGDEPSLNPQDLDPFTWGGTIRIVVLNGVFQPALSTVGSLPTGLTLSNPQVLSSESEDPADVFTHLNVACSFSTLTLAVARGVEVSAPIHLLVLSVPGSSPTVSHPRCEIRLDPQSSLTLIEDFVSVGDSCYFTNAVTKAHLGDDAQLTHIRLQREAPSAFHIASTQIRQARDSRYTSHAVNLGSQISRHALTVRQMGAQTETVLNGLTAIADLQLADTHTNVVLDYPQGVTRQLHKCIVDDRSHAVFNGKILVNPNAQMTHASQSSRNLLLSSQAKVDTKPQLEIGADNVKCAHGATVSELSADEVFYLQSRGIDAGSARRLLTYTFAAEVVERIPVPALKAGLAERIRAQTGA